MSPNDVWSEIRSNNGLSKVTVACIRVRQHACSGGWWRRVIMAPATVAAWAWVALVIGADIPAGVRIGPGLRLMHGGRGVVLHHTAVIGSRATVYHNVTVGVRGRGGAAEIGDDAYIGCGASVLGEVVIGDAARIGAMACVVSDVPAGMTAVGVPARVVAGVARQGDPRTVDGDEAPR